MASERFGVLDFTAGTGVMTLANDGSFDLDDDNALAEKIAGCVSFDEAMRVLWQPVNAAQEKTAERYHRIEAEAGDRPGDAILSKADAYLSHKGEAVVSGRRCLEAGGGYGKHLPGFARRFDEVIFLDCSLTSTVAARLFADDHGTEATYVRADVHALPFPDNSFDFVHQNGVVEHVHDPDLMLAESMRVLGPDGVYYCLSPNRYPITREPHFNLRLFGAIPSRLRGPLMRRARGLDDEAGTDLLSLRRLRRLLRDGGLDGDVFFLPPKLPTIARRTPLRRLVQWALTNPVIGPAVLAGVNRALLPVAPYHVAVGRVRRTT